MKAAYGGHRSSAMMSHASCASCGPWSMLPPAGSDPGKSQRNYCPKTHRLRAGVNAAAHRQ